MRRGASCAISLVPSDNLHLAASRGGGESDEEESAGAAAHNSLVVLEKAFTGGIAPDLVPPEGQSPSSQLHSALSQSVSQCPSPLVAHAKQGKEGKT